MKTELALSFIVDPTKAEDVDRLVDVLRYARQRGVTTVRGDLDQLDGMRPALGPGPLGLVAPTSAPTSTQCPYCWLDLPDALVRQYHARVCRARPPHYVPCSEGCGRTHVDSAQGRAQHRRRCLTLRLKEVSCTA